MRELARRAGTSHATLSRYEHGIVQPSLAVVERIVSACGLELRIHLDEPDTSDRDVAVAFLRLTPRQRLQSLANVDRLRELASRPLAAFDPLRLLAVLVEHEVEFIVVGQVAAVIHGHPETTVGLDILPGQTFTNAEHLKTALLNVDARHVISEDRDPLPPDEGDFVGWRVVRSYQTVAGQLDVIPRTVGGYEDHRSSAVVVDLDGFQVLVASLDAIIASKEAAGRPKDRRRLPSLQAFRDQLRTSNASEPMGDR
ncbi:hypothetical protein BH23ACT10_BH23ACT10_37830 [soil metagenome]